jgi:hypothetical protein
MGKIHRMKPPNTPNLNQTSLSIGLGHGVKCATVLEPFNLRSVESVRKLDIEGGTSVSWVDLEGHWFSDCDFSREKINL